MDNGGAGAPIPPPVLSSSSWPTNPKLYEFIGKIGQGAFATVWRARIVVADTTKRTTTITTASSDSSGNDQQQQHIGNDDDDGNKGFKREQQQQQKLATSVVSPTAVGSDGSRSSNDGTSTSSVVSSQQQSQYYYDCAIKVLDLDHIDTNLSEIRLEVQAMRLSSHPNVLTCYTAFINDMSLWLVTPLMKKGSSLHCLQTARRVMKQERRIQRQQERQQHDHHHHLPQQQQIHQHQLHNNSMEPHILYILHETLLGLRYIHDSGQIHRDIKAGNILLDEHGQVCIADFGVSSWLVPTLGGNAAKAQTFVGTPCWMAPEIMEQIHGGYDVKADVWSLGITALELAKGYAPYAKYPPMKVLILTIQDEPPTLQTYNQYDDDVDVDDDYNEEVYSTQFDELVALCLQKDPSKRPSCDELIQSKYFQQQHDTVNRNERREHIKTQVCDLVRDVGSSSQQQQHQQKQHPGHQPVSIILQQQEEDRPAGTTWVFADGSQVLASSTSSSANATTVDDVMEQIDEFGKVTGGENYYGQQQQQQEQKQKQQEDDTTAKLHHHNSNNKNDITDDNTLRKSNNYEHRQYQQQQQQQEQEEQEREEEENDEEKNRVVSNNDNNNNDDDDDDDDLDKFMDQFEQNTSGEDFRR